MANVLYSSLRDPALSTLEIGTGHVQIDGSVVRFVDEPIVNPTPHTVKQGYSNAQIYDYANRPRAALPCTPPIRLDVRARFSHSADDLRGTAGFGFWNQPIMPGQAIPRLPRNVWFFFGSRPSNMAFAYGVPGFGWKAATLDTTRLPFLLLAPTAPIGVLLMRIPALYRTLYPVAQWAIGAREKLVEVDMREWHSYRIEWLPSVANFYVDGALLFRSMTPPRGPLGLVVWLDNQYAVVTPQGNLAFGLLPLDQTQWMEIDQFTVEKR
jgi:hypothetical protein